MSACTSLLQFNGNDIGCRLNSFSGLLRARYTDFCSLDAAARNPGSLFPVFHFIPYGLRLLIVAVGFGQRAPEILDAIAQIISQIHRPGGGIGITRLPAVEIEGVGTLSSKAGRR